MIQTNTNKTYNWWYKRIQTKHTIDDTNDYKQNIQLMIQTNTNKTYNWWYNEWYKRIQTKHTIADTNEKSNQSAILRRHEKRNPMENVIIMQLEWPSSRLDGRGETFHTPVILHSLFSVTYQSHLTVHPSIRLSVRRSVLLSFLHYLIN